MATVGIRDVARHAGVSVGTVSNVLNRPGEVSAESARRVNEAIEALGYVRNDAARKLRAGVSTTVEVPITDVWTIEGDVRTLAQLQAEDRAAFVVDEPIDHYHRLQLDDFLLAVREGRSPSVTAADGRQAVQLVEGIYAAMRSGLPQALGGSDVPDGLA